MAAQPMTATCVVGAGPAGLLFCIAARILHERAGLKAPLWLAEEPYRELAADLKDPRFDAVIGFLAERRFAIEANVLEQRLLEVAEALGVHEEQCARCGGCRSQRRSSRAATSSSTSSAGGGRAPTSPASGGSERVAHRRSTCAHGCSTTFVHPCSRASNFR